MVQAARKTPPARLRRESSTADRPDGARKVFMERSAYGASNVRVARAGRGLQGHVYCSSRKAGFVRCVVRGRKLERASSFSFRSPRTRRRHYASQFGRAYFTLLCRPAACSALRTVRRSPIGCPNSAACSLHPCDPHNRRSLLRHLETRASLGSRDRDYRQPPLASSAVCQATVFQAFPVPGPPSPSSGAMRPWSPRNPRCSSLRGVPADAGWTKLLHGYGHAAY